MKHNPIILALDTVDLDFALSTAESLADKVGCFKVGLELLTAHGVPKVLSAFEAKQFPVFADVKFSDIPNTSAAATDALTRYPINFFTVHASAGSESIRAAATKKRESKLLVVTVLTSIDTSECHRIFGDSPNERVVQFAKIALGAGADGIICSPHELRPLSQSPELLPLLKITPGVRPNWTQTNDQKRTMTPAEAIRHGANYLVIGRAILSPPDGMTPSEAIDKILTEIKEASNGP